MFHDVNISKPNFWLVICIAKYNFKDDFLFLHPQIPDFQILSNHNKPYINGNIIYSAFIRCKNGPLWLFHGQLVTTHHSLHLYLLLMFN